MQNLTLPTSQTLALGNTLSSMEATKNSNNNNQLSVEPSVSFENMLKNQVKANKESKQEKNPQQNIAQKKTNQNTSTNQRQPIKAEQNNINEPQNQTDDEVLDQTLSLAQMLDNAKALLADKKSEETANDESLQNVANQDIAAQAAVLEASANLGASINPSYQTQNSTVDVNEVGLDNTLLDSSAKQIKPSVLTPTTGEDKTAKLEAKQLNSLDTKDVPEDRLIWASVSSSQVSQNMESDLKLNPNLNPNPNPNSNLVLEQNSNLVKKSKLDNAELLDVANLNISTQQQNQLAKSNAMLPAHQLGSSNHINAYPGKTGWDQAISQKIVWMVGAAEQTATLSLNPPELGPLQVVINVNNNTADTTFISNNAEVRNALQDGMANLREKMAESGIQLGQANVNSGGRSQQEFSSSFSNAQSTRASETDMKLPLPTTSQVKRLVQINNGLVDTFA